MRLKSSALIGKPIKSSEDAKRVGRIKDLILDAKNKKVQAILVSPKTLINEAKIILWESIEKLDEQGAEISSKSVIKKESNAPEPAASVVKDPKKLTKTKAKTAEGQALGQVKDVMIDTETGQVEAIETKVGSNIIDHQLEKIVNVDKKNLVIETKDEQMSGIPTESGTKRAAQRQMQEMKNNAKRMVSTLKDKIKGDKEEINQVSLPPGSTVRTPTGNEYVTEEPTILEKQ